MPATDLGGRQPALLLFQYPDDLSFREPRLLHCPSARMDGLYQKLEEVQGLRSETDQPNVFGTRSAKCDSGWPPAKDNDARRPDGRGHSFVVEETTRDVWCGVEELTEAALFARSKASPVILMESPVIAVEKACYGLKQESGFQHLNPLKLRLQIRYFSKVILIDRNIA